MILQSLLVYSLMLFVMTLCGAIASHNSYNYVSYSGEIKKSSFWRIEIIIPIILFSVIFGLRYDVGTDHLQYLNYYINGTPSKIEFLFKQITLICSNLSLHYCVYFGILSFIQIFFFYYAFKDEKYLYPFLAFFLFTNGEWFFWVNGIRQAIAMCIWIYSIKFIDQKKIIWYLFWGLAAFLFHRSAIILFIFYPLLKNGKDIFKSIPLQLFLFLSTFIIRQIFVSISDSFSEAADIYVYMLGKDLYEDDYNIDTLKESYVEPTGTGLVFMFKVALTTVIILYSKKMKEFYDSKRFLILYFFFFIGVITTFIFPAGFISFTRPFRYFYIFQSIILSYMLYFLSKKKSLQNSIVYWALIIIFLIIFFQQTLTGGSDPTISYKFFFQY